MPWECRTVEQQREEFVQAAQRETNFSALCREFEITRRTECKLEYGLDEAIARCQAAEAMAKEMGVDVMTLIIGLKTIEEAKKVSEAVPGWKMWPDVMSKNGKPDIDLTDYTPTREGYEFTGWYADEDLTDKITSIRLIRNTTVYAGWEEIKENPGTGFENPFTDVSENDWFYDDVMFVFINELMIGTSDTTFTPYGTTTRAMVATTLWRMDGSPEPKGENSFTDVENGKWYTEAITWAHENGITVGYGDNLFGTNDPVTREQLAAFFYRYAEYKGYDTTITDSLDRFIDKDDVSDWAKDAMAWAIGYGLIEGRENNVLDPKDNATRAEFAAMLHRFCERNELEKGITATGLTGWINPNMTTGVPQTGDSSHTTLWTSMLLFSLAACIAMIIALKRQKETGDEAQLINP